MKENRYKAAKLISLFIAVAVAFFLITRVFNTVEIILSIIILSFGVLAIIWTLLAKYNLSPSSQLRIFTNNFLATSIAVLAFTIIRLLGNIINIPGLIYIEFFFVFATFFFFVLASYYIYSLGREFGFQKESRQMKKILAKKQKKKL